LGAGPAIGRVGRSDRSLPDWLAVRRKGPNPKVATMGEGTNPQLARFPDKAVLRDYIGDIKRRIGAEGHRQTRLAVMLGHLSFDHGDAEATKFIALGFELALETDVAIGFHIDDSMFWVGRKDLWSDPNNVEALDWDGTPGFSTYPAPARFDDIYEELAKHKPVGWHRARERIYSSEAGADNRA
jgi:hypothetical protein